MDVERIQKINNLALSLMKQGLAADREDAINQAEKIFRNRDAEEYNTIKETMKEVKAEAMNSEIEKEQRAPVEELSQSKIQDILEQNTKFIVKKMREVQERINSLEREISQLRTQMAYNKLPTVKEIVSNKEQVAETNGKRPEMNVAEAAAPENHPRSGNYKDDDVSIEKFFYMGK